MIGRDPHGLRELHVRAIVIEVLDEDRAEVQAALEVTRVSLVRLLERAHSARDVVLHHEDEPEVVVHVRVLLVDLLRLLEDVLREAQVLLLLVDQPERRERRDVRVILTQDLDHELLGRVHVPFLEGEDGQVVLGCGVARVTRDDLIKEDLRLLELTCFGVDPPHRDLVLGRVSVDLARLLEVLASLIAQALLLVDHRDVVVRLGELGLGLDDRLELLERAVAIGGRLPEQTDRVLVSRPGLDGQTERLRFDLRLIDLDDLLDRLLIRLDLWLTRSLRPDDEREQRDHITKFHSSLSSLKPGL